MAVVKSPKNTKRKQLWQKQVAKGTLKKSVNYASSANKPFKVKPLKWTSAKSKSKILNNLVYIYVAL